MDSNLLQKQLRTLLMQSRLLTLTLLQQGCAPRDSLLLKGLELERCIADIEPEHLAELVVGPSGRIYCAGHTPADWTMSSPANTCFHLLRRVQTTDGPTLQEVYVDAKSVAAEDSETIVGWAVSPQEDFLTGMLPDEISPGVWETTITHGDEDETKYRFTSEDECDAFLEGLFAECIMNEHKTNGVFATIPWTPRPLHQQTTKNHPRFLEMLGQIRALPSGRKDRILTEIAAILFSDNMNADHEWTQDTIEDVAMQIRGLVSLDDLPTPLTEP